MDPQQPSAPAKREPTQVIILASPAAVAQAAADAFVDLAQESVRRSGRFTVALAGGNTPREAYTRIAAAEAGARRLPWDKIEVFFGDERPVPPDDPASNYRMAQESLLSRVPIPAANVHRIRAELGPETAAQEYERELREAFKSDRVPRFDLVLLGMGGDGHTASLFPGTAALEERSRLAVANWVEKLQQARLTLTLPVFQAAAQIVFTVVGGDKAEVLSQVLDEQHSPRYPAQLVQPASGSLRWIIDEAAAKLLPQRYRLHRSA